MPSYSHILNANGIAATLAALGEPVTFRNVEIPSVIIDRAATGPVDTREPMVTPADTCTITLRTFDVESSPQAGEYFVDEYDKRHRVISVRMSGPAYICNCITSG